MELDRVHVAGSEPYPWPWDGAAPAGWAVLVLDCADRPPSGFDARLGAFVVRARAAGCLVVSVRTGVGARAAASAGGPRRAADDALAPDLRVVAPGWDGFHATDLDGLLRTARRRTLLLVGHWLEIGVHSTLRSANDRGYECAVVAGLCAPADPELEHGALSCIQYSGGIFGAVVTADAVLDAFAGVPALAGEI